MSDRSLHDAAAAATGWPAIGAGFALTASYAALALRSRAPGGAELTDLAFATVTFGVVMGALAMRTRRGQEPIGRATILTFSFLFHAIGLLGEPVLEDDPARYRLDGWVFAEVGSPYGVAPSALFDAGVPPDVEDLLDEVNHPDIPTIYGPTLQWVFRTANAIAGTALWPIQLLMAIASFGLVLLIAPRASSLTLAFVAWHPLLIKEFAFTAHPDALAVALLLGAERMRSHRPATAGLVLGLAVGAKLFAVLALPWILFRSPRAIVAFVLTLAALYAPFAPTLLAASDGPEPHLAMGLEWIFNAPAHLVLAPILGALGSRGVLFGAFAVFVVILARPLLANDAGHHRIPGAALFGAMLLALPVLNPWYVVWPLAFWARRPTAWLATASVVVLSSYAHGLNAGPVDLDAYVVPLPIVAAESILVAAAGLWDLRRRASRCPQSRSL